MYQPNVIRCLTRSSVYGNERYASSNKSISEVVRHCSTRKRDLVKEFSKSLDAFLRFSQELEHVRNGKMLTRRGWRRANDTTDVGGGEWEVGRHERERLRDTCTEN